MKTFTEFYEEDVYLTEADIEILNESLKDFFKKSKRIEKWINRTLKTLITSKKHLDKNPPEGLREKLEEAKKAYENLKELEDKLEKKKITRKEFKKAYKEIKDKNKELMKLIKNSNVKNFLKAVGIPMLTTAAFVGLGKVDLSGLQRVLGSGAIIGGASVARSGLDDTSKFVNSETLS